MNSTAHIHLKEETRRAGLEHSNVTWTGNTKTTTGFIQSHPFDLRSPYPLFQRRARSADSQQTRDRPAPTLAETGPYIGDQAQPHQDQLSRGTSLPSTMSAPVSPSSQELAESEPETMPDKKQQELERAAAEAMVANAKRISVFEPISPSKRAKLIGPAPISMTSMPIGASITTSTGLSRLVSPSSVASPQLPTTLHSSAKASARNHVCPQCHVAFLRKDHLNRHMLVHTGAKAFPCPYPGCDKSFSRKDNMRQHVRSLHDTTLEALTTHGETKMVSRDSSPKTARMHDHAGRMASTTQVNQSSTTAVWEISRSGPMHAYKQPPDSDQTSQQPTSNAAVAMQESRTEPSAPAVVSDGKDCERPVELKQSNLTPCDSGVSLDLELLGPSNWRSEFSG